MQQYTKKLLRKYIVVAGKTPPPIGGVTIHVSRLLDHLTDNYPNQVFKKLTKISDLRYLPFTSVIHIHYGQPIFVFTLTVLSRIFFCKVIVTLHRDVKRIKGINYFFTLASAFLANKFITLNNKTYEHFSFIKNVYLASSFLPPLYSSNGLSIKPTDHQKILSSINNYEYIICSCSSRLNYFENQEIYGFFDIINKATKMKDFLFLLSDPSGDYKKTVKKQQIHIPDNIIMISYKHDFMELLKLSDIFIRNTSTDGDALSIKEALFLNKTVLATNVTNRPLGVITYNKHWDEILNKKLFVNQKNYKPESFDFEKFYSEYI